MSVIDCKYLIVNLLVKIDILGEEKVSAGTKDRLMGLVADIAEMAQTLVENGNECANLIRREEIRKGYALAFGKS